MLASDDLIVAELLQKYTQEQITFGRGAFLNGLLANEHLYLHPFFRQMFEQPARASIRVADRGEVHVSWLRWSGGRQAGGYEKMLLATAPFPVPFDLYLLRYRQGAHVPPHTDPVDGRRHYRANIVLRSAERGGDFICADPIFETRRVKVFRPDVSEHAVSPAERGTRIVLSLGWVRSR